MHCIAAPPPPPPQYRRSQDWRKTPVIKEQVCKGSHTKLQNPFSDLKKAGGIGQGAMSRGTPEN